MLVYNRDTSMLSNRINRILFWVRNAGKQNNKKYASRKARISRDKFREANLLTSLALRDAQQMVEWQRRYATCLKNNQFDPKIYSRPPKNIRGYIFSTIYHSI